ncbi:MAG: acyltransferase [Chitinophagaceae bacterium]|nr:acyltransferase [Chitinophagaceae bacterium]
MFNQLKTKNATGDNRIHQLDGLRAIALLMVLGFHLINNQLQPLNADELTVAQKFLMGTTYFGWCGVDLFFVLSGFLIGSILLKNKQSSNFFKVFYVRRFIRIIPAYYLLLIAFTLCKTTSWYNPDAYIFEKEIPIVYYFLFIQNFFMSFWGHFGAEALTPTWSLAIEEQFYIIIPLIIYLLRPGQLLFFIALCFCIAPLSRYLSTNWYQQYTLLSSRIDSPAMGVLIAYLNSKDFFRNFVKSNLQVVKLISSALFVFAGAIYFFSDPGIFNHTLIASCFGSVVIVILYIKKGFLYKVLTNPILLEIGKLSYFIYLFHQLINGMTHLVFLNHKQPILDNLQAVVLTVLSLFITYALSKLSFRYLEKPLINLGHSFKY